MIKTGKYLMLLFLFFVPVFPGISLFQPNYCHLYGTVYFEQQDPRNADFRVFVEETEGSADIWIYKTEEKLFADKPGLWHVTDKKAFADFIIYIEDNKYLADFSVYFIDVESFAGCND